VTRASISFPPFRVELDEERLWKGSKQLPVRRKPFAILRYLVANPKRLVTHDELLKRVWGDVSVSESAVRSHLHELRQVLGEGVIETVIGRGYRFTAELGADVPTVAPSPSRLVVGRTAELSALRAAFERAHDGHRQLCFVTGEPGIGKTTLVDAFLDEVDAPPEVAAVRGQCVEQHGTPEAYLPVIGVVGQLCRSAHGDHALAVLVRHAPTFLAQMPQLVPDAMFEDVSRRAVGSSGPRMVRELVEALEAIAMHRTLVVVLEDLQWSDVATIDLVATLGQRREHARLLVIGTSRRAEAQTASHPLNRVMRSLVTRGGATAIPVDAIAAGDITRLLELRFPGHALPPGLTEVLDRITGGTPLFLTSWIDDLIVRGMLAERDGRWTLTVGLDEVAAHRPDTVRQMIDIQLDRLSHDEQRMLEAASAVGTEFSSELVAAALERPVEDADEICDALARRALFLRREPTEEWPDGTVNTRYAMTHGLVTEVCTGRATELRRQRWHRLIAARLETAYAGCIADVALLLARHHEHGRAPARALHHYLIAADQAQRRYASGDAIRLYRHALELLPKVGAERERDELELRALAGMSPAVLRLHDELSRDPVASFERRVALARRVGDPSQLCVALIDCALYHSTRAQHVVACELLDQVDGMIAAGAAGLELATYADSARAVALFWRGELAHSGALFERTFAADLRPDNGFDVLRQALIDRRPLMLGYLAQIHWLTGAPDRALADIEQGLALATASGDPYTIGLAGSTLAGIHFLRRDPPERIIATANAVLALPECAMWHAPAAMLLSWARSLDVPLTAAEADAALADLRARLAAFPLGGTTLAPRVVAALMRSPRVPEARALIDEMLAVSRTTGGRVFAIDLLLLRAELAIDDGAVVADLREALALAGQLGAHSLVLRAALRIAALSPTPEMLARVAAALTACTDGADTADHRAARALLGR
jgi:DNA-binding winged helix-turn-helix (wHTH) protein/tetratricopeptide (TPR) repeat protein